MATKTRVGRIGCALVIVVTTLLVGAVVWSFAFAAPSINVTNGSHATLVDLSFLGEYCIGVSRVRLLGPDNTNIVWEVRAHGTDTGICKFELSPGLNGVRVGQPPEQEFTIVHPSAQTFYLAPGGRYQLEVWGNNGFGRWSVSRTQLTIPGATPN